jgi:hypothetical protein
LKDFLSLIFSLTLKFKDIIGWPMGMIFKTLSIQPTVIIV